MFGGELKNLEIFKIFSEIAFSSLIISRIKKYLDTNKSQSVITLSKVLLPIIMYHNKNLQPIAVAPRFNVCVCGCVCVVCVCVVYVCVWCVVLCVMCLCVCVYNFIIIAREGTYKSLPSTSYMCVTINPVHTPVHRQLR